MDRFYEEVGIVEESGGWRVALDGRLIKTIAGAPQVVLSEAMARDMAAEWDAQGEKLDPRALPMRDMADLAIDRILGAREAAIEDLLPFAQTDTLCYRAEADTALHQRQLEVWEPILTASEARHGIEFHRIEALASKPQPAPTLKKLQDVLRAQNHFTLAGLRTMAGLAGSLTIALTAIETDIDATDLFAAANLEEDWQAVQWGWDTEALEGRGVREAAFLAAARFARAAA